LIDEIMSKASQAIQKTTVLITGASSGIGYELTKLFAEDGYNLVLIARSGDKLAEIANDLQKKYGITVNVIAKDLSLASAPEEIYTQLQSESIEIGILVNNAGFASYGLFKDTDLNSELQMIQVNMTCLTHLTKLFLKDMLEEGYGKILNVASTAAFQPGPLMAVYFATKAYVLSFSEAIANELEGTGITVTALCPGPTESAFQQRAAMENSKLVKGQKIMDSQTVAKIGYRSLMEGKTVVIPGIKNQILTQSVRFAPRKIVTKIVRTMQDSK
jgi:uncharacterized protein